MASKSDFIRYAVLYHHGGLYMDADFLAVKDMDPILELIPSHDLVSYTTQGQSCQLGTFSSNFMGGREGGPIFKAVWEAQKAALTNHCDISEKSEPAFKLCCFPESTNAKCQVPWISLGEGIAHPTLTRLLAQGDSLNISCFAGDEGFVPEHIQSLITQDPHPTKAYAEEFWRNNSIQRPFDRIMYHLFNSNFNVGIWGARQVFNSTLLVGYLYTMSGVSQPTDPVTLGPAEVCAAESELCKCSGTVYYCRRWTDETFTTFTDLVRLTDWNYKAIHVEQSVECIPDRFGGDMLPGVQKHCICQKNSAGA